MLNCRLIFSRHNLALLPRPSLRLRAHQHASDAKRVLQAPFTSVSRMGRDADSIPHVDRTASEPRDPNLHSLSLAKIDGINSTIRLFKLRAPGDRVKFLPGQWLDVYLPGVDQAGGFTITSAPAYATPLFAGSDPSLNVDAGPVERENRTFRPYLELAVQKSPNAPAAWLWRPESEILGADLEVRVGGSFVYPPVPAQDIQKAVFVAGGVGINPLISMISHLHLTHSMPQSVEFIYATKVTDGEILFANRLLHIASNKREKMKLKFFLTGGGETRQYRQDPRLGDVAVSTSRRLTSNDVLEALGSSKREQTVCYVCGPPRMTDELVNLLRGQPGMTADRVLCEKWW